MSETHRELLDAILDSWDRNNTILVNLLRLVPAELMVLRGTATSQTLGTAPPRIASRLTPWLRANGNPRTPRAPTYANPSPVIVAAPSNTIPARTESGRVRRSATANRNTARPAIGVANAPGNLEYSNGRSLIEKPRFRNTPVQ